mmetsp:Transcript_7774/g.17055  ORF Transcript_7774/g.17055 Transcript_7774/m.17055 type:complete len:251 (+) Transcript_7774:96-848(+)
MALSLVLPFGSVAWQRDSESPGGMIGVPHGCIMRNGFLEFDDATPGMTRVRSKSCEPTPTAASLKPKDDLEESCHSTSTGGGLSDDADSTQSGDGRDRFDLDLAPSFGMSGHKGRGKAGMHSYKTHHNNMNAMSNMGSNHSQANSTTILLRGLPFGVSEDDVYNFIAEAGAAKALAPGQPVNLIINPQGRPSGFAEIQLKRPHDTWEVRQKLHMRSLGGRYIEALPARPGKAMSGPPQARRGSRSWRNRA